MTPHFVLAQVLLVAEDYHAMLGSGQGHINASVVFYELAVTRSHSRQQHKAKLSSLGLVNGQHLLSQLVFAGTRSEIEQSILDSPSLSSIGRDDGDLIRFELILRLLFGVR